MPWLSRKQQKWGHSPSGVKALGGESSVKEWDSKTDFKSLPEKKESQGRGLLGVRMVKKGTLK